MSARPQYQELFDNAGHRIGPSSGDGSWQVGVLWVLCFLLAGAAGVEFYYSTKLWAEVETLSERSACLDRGLARMIKGPNGKPTGYTRISSAFGCR